MSGFFKSKDPQVSTQFVQPEAFKATTAAQGADIASRIGQPGPAFAGERVAPLTSLQQTGIQRATEFAGAPVPAAFGLAQSEFVRQLTPTDPANTLLFKAVREGAKRNLQQSIEQISDISGGTGRAFTGARLEQEAKAAEGATINLNQILGQLALEQERQRISAAERLPGIAGQIAEFPLRQAQAAVSIGEVPRQIEQAQLDAQFQEFIRRFVTEPQQVSQLANQFIGLGAPSPVTTTIPGAASPFAQVLGAGGNILASAAGGGAFNSAIDRLLKGQGTAGGGVGIGGGTPGGTSTFGRLPITL